MPNPSARFAISVLAALALASPARAEPANLTTASGPNTYFNRPGADMAAHDSAVGDCLALAAREQQPNPGASASFMVSSFLDREMAAKSAVALSANTENCMVARGWRVVAIPQDEADAIAKLDRAGVAARIGDWVGAAAPHGTVVRQWANDMADAATVKFKTGPWSGKLNLSLSAIDAAAVLQAATAAAKAEGDDKPNLLRALAPDEIAQVPKDRAVVILRVAGPSLHAGDTIVLRRESTGAGDAPDAFLAYANPFWERGGKWSAFEAPPGRWRIASIGGGRLIFEVRLCLGAPSFQASAGEVVYAGTYDLSSAAIRPDLSLDAVRQWLAKSGDAADRVRPATYVNGSTGRCGGTYIYAYEIDGAPREPAGETQPHPAP
ncbi:MAG TPA: hypothetical protein VKU90_10440 [Caulobacteraceae bacterium]|nr:hypothetical protein [Caulobacteraceae bacterium]